MLFFYFIKSICCCLRVQIDEAHPLFLFRSAIRNAARSVPSPMAHSAAMARAAMPHVWYEFGLFTAQMAVPYS